MKLTSCHSSHRASYPPLLVAVFCTSSLSFLHTCISADRYSSEDAYGRCFVEGKQPHTHIPWTTLPIKLPKHSKETASTHHIHKLCTCIYGHPNSCRCRWAVYVENRQQALPLRGSCTYTAYNLYHKLQYKTAEELSTCWWCLIRHIKSHLLQRLKTIMLCVKQHRRMTQDWCAASLFCSCLFVYTATTWIVGAYPHNSCSDEYASAFWMISDMYRYEGRRACERWFLVDQPGILTWLVGKKLGNAW